MDQNRNIKFESIVMDDERNGKFLLFTQNFPQRPLFNPMGFALDQMRPHLNVDSGYQVFQFRISDEGLVIFEETKNFNEIKFLI